MFPGNKADLTTPTPQAPVFLLMSLAEIKGALLTPSQLIVIETVAACLHPSNALEQWLPWQGNVLLPSGKDWVHAARPSILPQPSAQHPSHLPDNPSPAGRWHDQL